MKRILFGLLMVGFVLIFVTAHGEEEFALAEKLITDKVPCDQLTDDQLEAIGEYYMEKMHPGELHERMDAMMGGEGSVQLKNVHISMARSFYCGEHGGMPWGMMNMMMGRSMNGMMNLGGTTTTGGRTMMHGLNNYGMMGWGSGYWNIFTFLYLLLIIGLVILVYLWIIKLLQENRKKR